MPFLRRLSRNDCAYSSIAKAQFTARAAWSGCSPGAPNRTCRGITNDLCNRTIVHKDNVSHACKIIVEKRPEHVGFECLDKRGKAGNVSEQRRDLPTLPAKVNCIHIAGKPLSKIGREVPRKRGMRPLCLRLPPPRLAQDFDMPNGLGDCRFEVKEIDGLGQEIERAA